MNNRRNLIVALGAAALAAPLISFAQQSGGMPRIGLLWIEGRTSSPYVAALRDGLLARGYVEGKNIHIDDHSLVKQYGLLSEAAGRLVSQQVDVIVCYGATAVEVASRATSSIPIVVVMSGDPVKLGVAANLSRPGGNVTGTSSISQELSGKRLELLKQIAPDIRRVAVILYPESASWPRSQEFACPPSMRTPISRIRVDSWPIPRTSPTVSGERRPVWTRFSKVRSGKADFNLAAGFASNGYDDHSPGKYSPAL